MASAADQLQRVLLSWRNDPVLFVKEALGATPAEWQAEALNALVEHDFLSIRSAHGVGKSAFLAWAILWYLMTRYPVKIPCTAPTKHQLYDVLWAEVSLWMGKMKKPLANQLSINTEKIAIAGAEMHSFAIARTARKENPDAFQGFHAENLMFIVDEASGVDDKIFEVGEGAMSTPGAKTIMVGNPTRRTGYFFDAFHKMSDYWWTKKVSAFDVQEQSYANIQNSERIAARWGKDSNVYRVRVLGEFPIENDDSVIPYWQVEAAIDRDVEPIANIQPIWGLDVARFGDCKTALAKRCGNILMDKVKTWRKRDTMEVAGLILYEYENTEPRYLPSEILVDSIGVGAGVVDRLREYGLPARGINVAEAATMRNDMTRLRDELWWRTREWFERQDVVIPEDEELIGQLTSIGYDAPFGKIKVWSKDKLRESGRESPDVADAFVLTFAGFDRRTVLMDRYTSNDNVLTFGSGRRSRNRRSGHSWYTR